MTGNISSTALAWLLTYAIHSTVLLALVWLLARSRRLSPGASELLWKAAMVGAILTASTQLWLDVRPAGTVMLRETGSGTVEAQTRGAGSAPREAQKQEARSGTHEDNVNASVPGKALKPSSGAPLPASRVPFPALAVLAWGLVALILGLSYVARRLILVGRLGDRREVPDGALVDALTEVATDAGLRTTPRLTSTSRISSPVAIGIDEICVPETALSDLDPEQQRSLLAHELAHVARRDPVWLVAGSLIERVFWIQPLNRIANREIATSAEFLCDDWAVHRTGSGVPLARCLAQVAEWIQASPLGVPVAGMAEERSLLVTRVARLVDGVKPTTRSRRGLAVAAVVVLVATILVAPGVSGKTQSVLMADETHAPAAPQTTNAKTDTGVVNALIERLGDENADVRSAAANSLGKLKDSRAVPGLIGALKDRDAKVRQSAADALGEFEDPRAIAPLADLLNDQSTEVKRTALDALSHYDDNLLPAVAIVRLLNDPDDDVRHNAAHLAGKLHDRSAIGALAKLIHDPSSDVRQAAIESIGELGDPTAAAAIIPALSDANADVREQALGAIDDLKAPLPEATLIALMSDRDPDVRERAAGLAGDRKMAGAVPTLRRMLDDPNPDVRERAVNALGDIPDNAAYDALRVALTSKDAKVRRAAAEALGDRR